MFGKKDSFTDAEKEVIEQERRERQEFQRKLESSEKPECLPVLIGLLFVTGSASYMLIQLVV